MELEAGSGDVKIIGAWPSPFPLRPRIAFNLKGVHYEFLEEDFNPKSDLLLKSNPVYKKIPVLLHHGKPICESTIIVQYIDDVWATPAAPLLPADPYDRAIHRFWASYVDDKFLQAMDGALKSQNAEAKREHIGHASAALELLEGALEECGKGKGFFNGDDIGYLDLSLGCYLAWVRVLERTSGVELLDAEHTPLLARWAERFCAHEAVKVVMPDTERLLHFVKTVAEPKWKAAAAAAN